MKLNLRSNFSVLVLFLAIQFVFGQYESQYTQYMYNTSIVNPGYSGSEEALKVGLLHRSQWQGIDGAPCSQTLNIENRFFKSLGVSLNASKDEIGPDKNIIFDLNVAYHLQINAKTQLSLGLKGGGRFFSHDLSQANMTSNQNVSSNYKIDNKFYPSFGAGLYLYNEHSYVGFSVPNLLEDYNDNIDGPFSSSRHYYLILGTVMNYNKVKIKPSTIVKAVEGAPLSIDASLNFMFYDRFVLGGAYRYEAALSGLIGFQITKNLFLGYAYDFNTALKHSIAGNTQEFFLGYMLPLDNMYESPRFF
ncbi:MAG: PorP/SprF family type IX secretion system membrane protein [Flavicella sp.]